MGSTGAKLELWKVLGCMEVDGVQCLPKGSQPTESNLPELSPDPLNLGESITKPNLGSPSRSPSLKHPPFAGVTAQRVLTLSPTHGAPGRARARSSHE